MKFTRQHYVTLAKMVSEFRADALDRGDMYLLATVETFRDRMIESFAKDNPRFKPEVFRKACEK